MITPGELAERIRQHGSAVRGGPTQWSAQCPAHDDRAPSLSIGTGAEGVPLVHCQAGCRPEEVLGAVGLTLADLMPDRDRPERPRVVATYPYCDENGVLLYEVRRIEPGPDGRGKTFRPYRPGATRAGLGDVRRVLYRLPEVIQAAAAGGTVYVCEGEKDVDLLTARGYVATCNVGGAGRGKWRDEYSTYLAGAHVVVVADRDAPGIEHARAVADALTGHAASVRIMLPAVDREHADVADHLAAGHDVDALVPLGDEPQDDATPDSPTQSHGTTWDQEPEEEGALQSRLAALRALMVDTDGLDDIPDPEPVIDDVVYLDSLAWLHGKPGHGKSFVALDWAGCVATGRPWQGHGVARPGAVVYLVAEGARGVRQRVRAWESYHGTPMRGVQFLPTAVQLLDPIDREAFARLVADHRPVLVVIDTQARVSVGADENSAQDMGRLIAAADLIRERTGACVLLVHHEARQGETLRGSTALEGAAHTLVRVTRDGTRVRVDCTKQKDAAPFDPLLLRLTAHGPSAVLESHGGVGLAEELAGTEQRLIATLRDSFGTTGATGAQLREVSEIPRSSFYRALNSLVTMGLVVNTGTAKRPFYVLAERAPNQQSHAVPRSPVGLAGSQSHVPPPYRGGTGGTDRPTGPDEGTERGALAEETPSALAEVPEEWGEWSA